ncbi:MAG TPA: beta-ribofuranosylaminobenzene 5'-phosphate synthase family protein [Planctomycetota bacterium]|nr:beta-ribofuranosylaminobenzene 5'-phosphate synthase family protein [Planctomycetota bacterium]
MILEGIVTTTGPGGRINISPMGPRLGPTPRRLTLRPFRTSRTYSNLKILGEGVFHVTDDVELLARAAVEDVEAEMRPARRVRGHVLAGACRAYEFRVTSIDDTEERATFAAEVVHEETMRDFLGFNRGKHAVLEAAILATRLSILPRGEVLSKLAELRVLVEKTGGDAERRAFQFLEDHAREAPGPGQEDEADGSAGPISTRVETGSRLHFGLLAPRGASPRHFGGAGVMVNRPAIRLRAERSDAFEAAGPHAERALDAARRAARERSPPCRILVEEAPPGHRGLGTGTQIALAAAAASTALGGERISAASLAAVVGRGGRSGIGVHGFERGGFILDGGKGPGADAAVAPLLSRLEVPADWRFVLACPAGASGISGKAEDDAFRTLDRAPDSTIEVLCRLLILGLAPALAEGDLAAFGESLHEYGRRAGELFKSAQGGAFAGPEAAGLVRFFRSEGVRGTGQSSWGPTVYAVVEDEGRAGQLAALIAERFGGERIEAVIAAPRNRGAAVETFRGAVRGEKRPSRAGPEAP